MQEHKQKISSFDAIIDNEFIIIIIYNKGIMKWENKSNRKETNYHFQIQNLE